MGELHETHPRVSQMKGLYLWWPSMDPEIKMLVKICNICQSQHHSPPVSPLHPWEWPEEPWSCIHIAYVGPFLWMLVDTYSKWLDVHITSSSISQFTIIEKIIANMGLPSFTSSEFQDFMKQK